MSLSLSPQMQDKVFIGTLVTILYIGLYGFLIFAWHAGTDPLCHLLIVSFGMFVAVRSIIAWLS